MSYSPLVYPYTTPQYLTEEIFVNCGKFTGTATNFQINLAFMLAEIQVQEELNTYLSPTEVTVEVSNFVLNKNFYLPTGKLLEIKRVVLYRQKGEETLLVSGYGIVANEFYGVSKINASPHDINYLPCNSCLVSPNQSDDFYYKASITYVSGYPSGTHNDPRIRMALSEAADLNLKTLRDEGELADEAHQFIRSYSIGRYSQSVSDRYIRQTRFGLSGKAQFIGNLLETFKIRRARVL